MGVTQLTAHREIPVVLYKLETFSDNSNFKEYSLMSRSKPATQNFFPMSF